MPPTPPQPPESPPAVETARLVKLFGATPALLQVDLSVPPGTICAVVGDNGAGKTTLLRVLATGLRPTSGTARVYGLDVRTSAAAVRRAVAWMPSTAGLYPELTAIENLRFATRMRGLGADEAELERTLVEVGLAGQSLTSARSLSTGMARRLALACLLLARPRLALLDEPYAALDGDGRALVDRMLRRMRADGRTVLVATHEHDRMALLADMVVRLRAGLVCDVGADRSRSSSPAAAAGP